MFVDDFLARNEVRIPETKFMWEGLNNLNQEFCLSQGRYQAFQPHERTP